MNKIALTLLLLSIYTFEFHAQTKRKSPAGKKPTAVISAKNKKLAPPPKAISTIATGLGVVFERYQTDIEVNADGTAVQTWEVRQRLNSPQALERFANFQRLFNGGLEKAEVIEAFILKADGVQIPVKGDKIQIKPTPQAEAAPSFSSLKMIEINFSEAKKGDAVCYKIRLHTTKPHFAGHFDELEVFPNIFEYQSIEINLSAPKNYPLYVQSSVLEGGKVSDKDDRAHWHWQLKNAKAIEPETMMYDFFTASPRLAITSFKNYDELGAAYWTEAREKTKITPEIETLAHEITKDIKEPQAQAYAIYEWVNKNVRYLSVVLERGGWVPHESKEILANGYGDCKDYTTILYSLLRAKNIESHPVIIRAEMTDWFPDVAVPSFFNHAILYIPSLDLYADATAPNTRLGLIPQTLVGKKAFLAGEKTGVVKTPDNKPEDNQLLSEIEISFAGDGSLKSFSKTKYLGRAEILFRPMFTDPNLKQNSESFVRFLLAYYGIQGTGKLLKVGNPFKANEPFEVEMQTEVADFTTFAKQGAVRLPVALNLINMLELEKYVVSEQRKSNLVMGATIFKETFKLKFPAGVQTTEIPTNTDFSNAVGSFRNDYKLEDDAVKVTRELSIKKDVITPNDYPKLRELINKTVASFNTEIKYQSTAEVMRQSGKRVAKPSAKAQANNQLTSDELLESFEVKKLSSREITRMEAGLKQNPNDEETRKQLLRFYTEYNTNETAARSVARINHRLWFVRNRPDLEKYQVYGNSLPSDRAESGEFQTLKTEWLKQVAAHKSDARVRLNAVQFFRLQEPKTAERLLLEGASEDNGNYEFPLKLSEIYKRAASDEKAADFNDNLLKSLESGESALRLLKKERSAQRDEERGELLESLSKTAFKLENFDRAAALATELILDFGGDAQYADFDDAAHIGNTILGLIAVRRNDLAKAREYLLISVRAPLRKKDNYLTEIETDLAKALFLKGEKDVVLQYLKLCGELWHLKSYTDLYADEIKALTQWQEEIKTGKTPSFNFDQL